MEWCEMRVIFYADKNTRNILAKVFSGLAKNEPEQMPPFIKGWADRYANIVWSESEEVLYYQTKDSPNIDELLQLAGFYSCAFECTYKLPNSNEFNRVLYKDGILTYHLETKMLQDSREITIIDLEGKEKKITDLEGAIAMTADFMTYGHEDKSFGAFDEKMRRYWTDLHTKLTAIKNSINNNQNDIDHEKSK